MDTFKDRQQLEDIYSRGGAPWEVWNGHAAEAPAPLAGVGV
jgi:glucose-1-phosphate cytidylyltransferase